MNPDVSVAAAAAAGGTAMLREGDVDEFEEEGTRG